MCLFYTKNNCFRSININQYRFPIINTSIGATSYLWDFANGITSTDETPKNPIYRHLDTYTITLHPMAIKRHNLFKRYVYSMYVNTHFQ